MGAPSPFDKHFYWLRLTCNTCGTKLEAPAPVAYVHERPHIAPEGGLTLTEEVGALSLAVEGGTLTLEGGSNDDGPRT